MEEKVSLFWHMADRPSCAFSCVPLPGDLGNSYQGFGVQFMGLSLETQSRRCQGAKREREKAQEAGQGWSGPGRARGACGHSQGRLEESCPEEGSVQAAQESSSMQQRGARGQGVTSSGPASLRGPLGSCGAACPLQGGKVPLCPSKPSQFVGIFRVLG